LAKADAKGNRAEMKIDKFFTELKRRNAYNSRLAAAPALD
jgi:hypothetical protein